ncbi:histidinol-phosphatase HisJ [Alkalicoccobacillus porphyridii]|uniref:Histidinol-phosphatase n=1 Tax=Alkalicoccobacillus porphyridii TaxID=2597270 RepID=A0A554A4H8_9BACI|nr:histidinol-phosphatase HisJ [Alkalicoccobacillus porphyridii]
MLYDGHVHTPFCPHGTKDTLASYCEQAIKAGLKGISFTEHAPLPEGFTDTAPKQDSAMSKQDFYSYIEEVQAVRSIYQDHLAIGIGLEVDYIEGFEEQTALLLNEVGPFLTDSILSVHFLKHGDTYTCMDYSPDVLISLASSLGSIDAVHTLYYQTVLKSIQEDLGPYKPRRIGHMTLANKFQIKAPPSRSFIREQDAILSALLSGRYSLDFNVAGLRKPLCKETYPPLTVAKQAASMGIPLVFGSDAHQYKEMDHSPDDYQGLSFTAPISISE